MIYRLLPLLLICLIAAPVSASILLNESHGSTWAKWSWNVSALEADQVLIARYDGAEVLNQTAATAPPLLQYYAVSGIGPNEPHTFDLVLLNSSTVPPTVIDFQDSAVTTGQAESNYLIYLGIAVALFLVSVFWGRQNRIIALFLAVIAFLLGGYTAAANVEVNSILFWLGVLVSLISVIGLVLTFLDLVREQRGWGDD